MTESVGGPGFTLGFSLQPGPDGKAAFVGMHFETPFAAYSLALPEEWAEQLVTEFPAQLTEMVRQLKRAKSDLILAPETALNTLKGNTRDGRP